MIKEAKIVSLVSLFPLPQYVVVLEDVEKTKLVPIWIGINEGNAIALEMQGEKFPRPLTHDLMVNFLKELHAEVEKVVVSDLRESSYYALIYLKHDGKTVAVDARPSDSLALAVRLHCPIYIDEQVLKKCPAVGGPISKDEIEKFKDSLKTLSPEEFFKKLEEAEPAPGPQEMGLPPFDPESEGEEEDDEEDDEEEKGF
ncbi:MAG: bifunctional nuclease family protein [Candidatus Omnitrophica bacterium]|nr:bifunctional nuclease family protein [Candidatus Omnitrophota bacterium]